MYTFLSQPPNFTLLLLTETGVSTNFSSGRGSHRLLDRLLGLLYFGNDATGVEDCEFLQPTDMSQICISGIRTIHVSYYQSNNCKRSTEPRLQEIKPQKMKKKMEKSKKKKRQNTYSLLAKSGFGNGKRGSVSQFRV